MKIMNFMLMVRNIKGVTIMMELNCELNNGVKVKTYTAIGARYLSVYMPQANDRTASYTLSIDEWDANKIIKLLNKMMYGDTLYLLETGADGFTEHIHKYESGATGITIIEFCTK